MESIISPLESLHEFLFSKRKHLSSFNVHLKKKKSGAEIKVVRRTSTKSCVSGTADRGFRSTTLFLLYYSLDGWSPVQAEAFRRKFTFSAKIYSVGIT